MKEITAKNESCISEEVNTFIQDMIKKYHYRPIPATVQTGSVKSYYRDRLPAWAKIKISRKYPLKTKQGDKLCEAYEKIVVGDYGAYVEISASHLLIDQFIYIDEQDISENIDTRQKSYMTFVLNTDPDFKILFQVKSVAYGNFIPGRFYVNPYTVISDRPKQ